jgi:hypothetical protein
VSDRPFVPTPNKNVPQVQEPVADLGSLLTTVKSLKQGVESLGGYRGEMVGRAVTFNDLVGLGLVPGTTFSSTTGTGTSGVATNTQLQAEAAVRAADDQEEEAARMAADQGLADGIDAEATIRAADDAAETGARAAADTVLQDDIDAESISRANADAAEAADRIAADTNLQNQINALQTPVVPFSGLPASPAVGFEAVVTDATVNSWGAAVTVGGGAMVVKVWWTGGVWSVLGRV